ncbi:MAG: hypothetical protein ABR532_08410 [Candidatus Dormibacteria bacterium]
MTYTPGPYTVQPIPQGIQESDIGGMYFVLAPSSLPPEPDDASPDHLATVAVVFSSEDADLFGGVLDLLEAAKDLLRWAPRGWAPTERLASAVARCEGFRS